MPMAVFSVMKYSEPPVTPSSRNVASSLSVLLRTLMPLPLAMQNSHSAVYAMPALRKYISCAATPLSISSRVFMNVPPHISVTITAVTSYFIPVVPMLGKVDANLHIFRFFFDSFFFLLVALGAAFLPYF